MAKSSFHESFEAHGEVRLPSNRTFGLVMAAFFAVVAGMPMRSGHPARVWAAVVAVAFVTVSLIAPRALLPLNRLWLQLGLLLGQVASLVSMSALFFLIFSPAAIVLRLMKKDLLLQRLEPGASSYWLQRDPPGPAPASMRRQF